MRYILSKDLHASETHSVSKEKIKSISKAIPDDGSVGLLAELFGVLADSTRLKIVFALQNSELCVHEIAESVKMSISAVSHQLRLLKAMKLVKYRKEGKMVFYLLDDSHIEHLLKIAKEHVQE